MENKIMVIERLIKAAYLHMCFNAYLEDRADLYLPADSLKVHEELKLRKQKMSAKL